MKIVPGIYNLKTSNYIVDNTTYMKEPKKVILKKAKYRIKHQNALIAINKEDGSVFATLSVCLSDKEQEEDEIFIKNYGENTGFLNQLIEQGVVGQVLRVIQVNYVVVHVCKLLV